jgi:capsule polysaccharide modification protein KpsS
LDAPDEVPSPLSIRHAFAWSVLWTILNSLLITLGAFRYPNYRHHRDVQTWRQMWLWARGFWRRIRYAKTEAPLLPKLCGEWSGAYFLVGLQVFNDSQVSNSRFKDVSEFIREVVDSFAAHAPLEARLVVKHHPADRPYRDYTGLLDELARKHDLGQRIVYVHDLHLPALLRHARGTVVINSTVGFSSLFHRTPVKALCDAVYVRMGLSADVPLDVFWRSPPPVDFELYRRAQRWLVHNCQANGSVWCKLQVDNASGMLWPVNLRPQSAPRVRSSTASASRSR